MTPPLFWVDDVPAVDAEFELSGPEAHHAVTVLRLAAGDRLSVSDGRGALADCAATSIIAKNRLAVRVRVRHETGVPRPTVTVVQALPKSDRSELAVELATEAGADRIVAWQSERCVARWTGDREGKGLKRWRQAAATAAKQSRRPRIPEVTGVATTAQIRALIADTASGGGLTLVLHESGTAPLAGVGLTSATSVLLIVGPEGGLTPGELDDFVAIGAHVVRLGPEVLRTSTAAAVALGAVGALTDRWNR